MKVILLNGSPNLEGCTYTALREVESALLANGIETELIQMGKSVVSGCTACGACGKTGRCIFSKDKVNETIEKMERADGLVVGSPVYYASPNGSIVSFLDRMFYAGNCFAYKPAAAIASARRAGTTATLDMLHKYFTISNMMVVSSQYWNMVHGNSPEQVRQDEEGMQTMRALGNNMAWLLKCIQAGKEAGIPLPQTEERKWTNFIR